MESPAGGLPLLLFRPASKPNSTASSSSLSTKIAAAIPSASGGTSNKFDRAVIAGCPLPFSLVDFDSSSINRNSLQYANKVIDTCPRQRYTFPPWLRKTSCCAQQFSPSYFLRPFARSPASRTRNLPRTSTPSPLPAKSSPTKPSKAKSSFSNSGPPGAASAPTKPPSSTRSAMSSPAKASSSSPSTSANPRKPSKNISSSIPVTAKSS